MTKFNDEMQKLIQKAKSGGQVTLDDLEILQNSRPGRVSSAKGALKKAIEGRELNKSELDLLARDPESAFAYAKHRGKPFPECEDHLLKSKSDGFVIKYFELFPQVNKKYEDWLIRGSLPEHEQNILNYCVNVLKKRWKEGEKVLLKMQGWNRDRIWFEYQKNVVKGRWPELERRLFSDKKVKKDKDIISNYFNNLGLGRHEELEGRLLKSGTCFMIYRYALNCVGGRLPDSLHNKMLLVGKKWTKRYLKSLATRRRMTESFLASLNDEERQEILMSVAS